MTQSIHEHLHENLMDHLEQRSSLLGFEGRNSCIRKIWLGKDSSSSMIPWHDSLFESVWLIDDVTVSYDTEIRSEY